jgi:hypothetical protein
LQRTARPGALIKLLFAINLCDREGMLNDGALQEQRSPLAT